MAMSMNADDNELPLLSDESLAMMVEKECQHWPGLRCLNKLQTGDLDFGARMEVVDRILKVSLTVLRLC